jgi:hypothetical protein
VSVKQIATLYLLSFAAISLGSERFPSRDIHEMAEWLEFDQQVYETMLTGKDPKVETNLLQFLIDEGTHNRDIWRHGYRDRTVGPKWRSGKHCMGCIMAAPDYVCVCDEFQWPIPERY